MFVCVSMQALFTHRHECVTILNLKVIHIMDSMIEMHQKLIFSNYPHDMLNALFVTNHRVLGISYVPMKIRYVLMIVDVFILWLYCKVNCNQLICLGVTMYLSYIYQYIYVNKHPIFFLSAFNDSHFTLLSKSVITRGYGII